MTRVARHPATVITQALLFDMDGTLVDSAASIDATWLSFAERHGISPGTIRATLPGRTARDIVTSVLPGHPDLETELSWIRAREESTVDGVTEIPGAQALLASIPAQRWALVTSASRTMATRRLAAAGLPVPGVMICAEDVLAGKPDPEGFRTAARLVGADIGACLAFEDSDAGLLAIRRSGATPVAIGGNRSLGGYSAADLTAVTARSQGDRIIVEIRA
ncbi:HAD-IA family hydrolase [Nocardia sp. NPDC051030]|uniref:HAD-IA family hydrolase n=1 Tax=Nocardia sp. NPDC051030 TaxID=3155162 RepID=UPI00341FF2D5